MALAPTVYSVGVRKVFMVMLYFWRAGETHKSIFLLIRFRHLTGVTAFPKFSVLPAVFLRSSNSFLLLSTVMIVTALVRATFISSPHPSESGSC